MTERGERHIAAHRIERSRLFTGHPRSPDRRPGDDGLATMTSPSAAPPWRFRTFGPASEQPYRRRVTDWFRIGTAVVLIALCAAHVHHLWTGERAVWQFFNTMPSALTSLALGVYRVAAIACIAVIAAAALVARRWRLARDFALSALLAFAATQVLSAAVSEPSHVGGFSLHVRWGTAPQFPVLRLALVMAVFAGASPYLSRPSRRVGLAIVVAVAFAALYLAAGSPTDVVAALALGWGAAAVVHLWFGSPAGRPTARQVTAALRDLGIDAQHVQLAPDQPVGGVVMLGADAGGPLEIKLMGRDEIDAQFLSKLWRFVLYRDSGPVPALTRLQELEYEAYVTLLAERAGVRVPDVIATGKGGPGTALLVERPVEGPRLAALPVDQLTDDRLEAVWGQVAALHAARVTHGRLNARHIAISPSGPAIVDLGSASISTAPQRQGADVAELLASTARLVGPSRAAATARRGIGREALAAALPLLQSAALSHETRAADHRGRELRSQLSHLREESAAAAEAEPPPLQQLHRVRASSLLLAVGTLVAVFALLMQVGDPTAISTTLRHAEWSWIAVALALAFATNVPSAVGLMGTVPFRLPLGPTTELELAMSFSNLAVPAVGGTAIQVRFLQKQGADLTTAVAAGGVLSSVANVATQLALFVVAVWLAPNRIHLGRIPTGGLVVALLGAALVIGAAVALIFGVPRLRRSVVPPMHAATSTLWTALRSPSRLVLLLGGNLGATLLSGFCLLACLEAFGASVSLWTLLALSIGIGTLAALVPIPGGGTAVSSVGLSGALVAVGVPKDVAVSAILVNQLVATYLPAVPGWFATRRLMRHDYL